jgi:hypothetical protein
MADTVIADLNVKLAYLLGDPYTPKTQVVTALDDGIAYTAVHRDYFLTKGLRQLVALYGATSLAASGVIDSYMREKAIDANPFTLPEDVAILKNVQWYGKKVNHIPMADGRRNSIYWQNTPMYRISLQQTDAILIVTSNMLVNTDYCSIFYVKRIPMLSSDPAKFTEDILINENYHDKVLAFAELTGRRFHQEMHKQIREEVLQDMAITKQNEG